MKPEKMSVPLNPPPAFHLLVKPTGAICNLKCEYCFYLDKENRYPGGKFRMTDALLEIYVRQLVEAHRIPEITMAWQGGEPLLMGLDFFRRGIDMQKKYQRPGVLFINTIQTNGTLIDQEWAQFFKENNFLVGISIDGPREMHDAYRRDKTGRPTFERVIEGLNHLKNQGVEFNALVTIHKANADRPLEVYRFLRDELGIRFIQFIPIVERQRPPDELKGPKDQPQKGSPVTPHSVTPESFGRFLKTVFDEWVRHDVGETFVNMFDVALANWFGEPSSLCVFAPTCGLTLAMEHNGDLYSCDHFVDPEHFLGNLSQKKLTELVASPKQVTFGRDKLDLLPRYCRECRVRFACHGGCPKDRFTRTPEGAPGLNYLCSGYQAFFTHIERPMSIMTELLRMNRAPAEIMALYAGEKKFPREALSKVGRNDPCPCGSGEKFKNCHGL
ncbi:MAG: anaerobic sulfatase maturase [Thermodesulfobacteriota bacterium]